MKWKITNFFFGLHLLSIIVFSVNAEERVSGTTPKYHYWHRILVSMIQSVQTTAGKGVQDLGVSALAETYLRRYLAIVLMPAVNKESGTDVSDGERVHLSTSGQSPHRVSLLPAQDEKWSDESAHCLPIKNPFCFSNVRIYNSVERSQLISASIIGQIF